MTPDVSAIDFMITFTPARSHPPPLRRVITPIPCVVSTEAGHRSQPNREHSMKPLLALVTLALTALIFEERARQVAGEAQEVYNEMVTHANEAKQALTGKVERQPLVSLLVAGGVAYVLASIIPSRG
jgi:hypothetical protein